MKVASVLKGPIEMQAKDVRDNAEQLPEKVAEMMKRNSDATRQSIAQKGESRCILNPRKSVKLTWDACNVLVLMYSLAEIFYSLAFTKDSCDWNYLTEIEMFVDIFFICDCVLSFFTSYEDPQTGIEVTDHGKIARNYLRGWFTLDVISSFPLNRVVCAVGYTGIDQVHIRLLKVVRLIKVTRFLRMLRTAARLEEELGHLLHNSVRFIKFFSLMALFIHLCACMWYATIAYTECRIPRSNPVIGYAPCGCDDGEDCRDWNWLIKYSGGQDQYDMFYGNQSTYMVSLYYSVVTLSTLGYGDITPANDTEQVVAAMLALGGAIMFSVLIGSIGTLITTGNVIARYMDESVLSFVDLCRFKSVSSGLEKKVRKQVDYIMIKAPHRFIEIDVLHRTMQDEILEQIGHDLFGHIDFFKDLTTDYKSRLVRILRPGKYNQGDYVYKTREIATEMYWVARGAVSIVKEDLPEDGAEAKNSGSSRSVTSTAGKEADVEIHGVSSSDQGSIFGAVEIFEKEELDQKLQSRFGCRYESSYSKFRIFSAKAKTRCELLELTRDDLYGVIKVYMPDLYEAILNHAGHSIMSYMAELPQHEQAMGERFRRRKLKWQEGLHDKDIKRLMARGPSLPSGHAVAELVLADAPAGDHASAESQQNLLLMAAGAFGAHTLPGGPSISRAVNGTGSDAAELSERRRDSDIREMKAQLAQLIAALGVRPAMSGGVAAAAGGGRNVEGSGAVVTSTSPRAYQDCA
jgi:CRP-like cAMP-binding protein